MNVFPCFGRSHLASVPFILPLTFVMTSSSRSYWAAIYMHHRDDTAGTRLISLG
jgi:hypothetical protein